MDITQIIERLGGTAKTAEICSVTPGAVSQWKTNGIPKARLMYLQVVYPHLFPPQPSSQIKVSAP